MVGFGSNGSYNNNMTLPKLTKKEKETAKLIYDFRFLSRTHIQLKLHHKHRKTTNELLKSLTEKNYLKRIYSKKLGENINPAIYFADLNLIRYLKTQDYTNPVIIQKLYRETKRKEQFIAKCLLLADISIKLREKNNTNTKYSILTQSLYLSPTSSYKKLKILNPDGLVIKIEVKKTRYFFLEIVGKNISNKVIRRRLLQYFECYFNNKFFDLFGKEFPTLLLILPNLSGLINTKKLIAKLLEEEKVKNLNILVSTVAQVNEKGITEEIWEEV